MRSRDFVYWLQGFFEVTKLGNNNLTPSLNIDQVKCIQNHLNMVFKHEIDPGMGSVEHQKELGKLHGGLTGAAPSTPSKDSTLVSKDSALSSNSTADLLIRC